MKLYRVPQTIVCKIPHGKIIKYIRKNDNTLTPKTGIILKHQDNKIVLKSLGCGLTIWSINTKDTVCYVTKDILDSIKAKKKPKNKINKIKTKI